MEEELNVQHSTPNAQRRIKEILNKEMTNKIATQSVPGTFKKIG